MKFRLYASFMLFVNTSAIAFNIITTGTPKSGISMLTDTICSIINSTRKATIAGDVLLTDEQMRLLGSRYDLLTGTPVCNEQNCTLVTQYHAKVIYIIRDPRDQLCSTAQTIYEYRKHIPAAQGKNFDTILLELIQEGGQYYAAQYPFDELYTMHGIADLYNLWTPWMKQPHVLVVSFEKLTGNQHERLQEIQRIADFLNVPLSAQRAQEISTKNTGGWFGFFKKQPSNGMWKKLFKAQHHTSFNERARQLCIDLGYIPNT